MLGLLGLVLVPTTSAQSIEPGQTFSGKVTSVADGDTYDVRRSIGGTVTVRLWDVDAPESAQLYDTTATRASRRYVCGKGVRVVVEEIGRTGRAVARINV
jgi:endonuclease YncB( thermonuclease family)